MGPMLARYATIQTTGAKAIHLRVFILLPIGCHNCLLLSQQLGQRFPEQSRGVIVLACDDLAIDEDIVG